MNVTLGRFLDRFIGVPVCYGLWLLERLLPGTRLVYNRDPERVLIIKLFGLGNVVELMPALAAVRRRFPAARITVLTLESNAGILEGFGPVDEMLYFKDNGWLAAMVCALRLMPALYGRRFELVLDMDPIGRFCTLLAWFTRAPHRLGFATRGQYREQLYTLSVPLREDQHIRHIFMDLLQPLGVISPGLPELLPPPVPTDTLRDITARVAALPGTGPLVVVNPNASTVALERRWPVERYAGLIRAITQRHPARVVVVGAPGEAAHVASLMALLPSSPGVANWAGTTSLTELSALLSLADLVISNDTGPMHLACAHGVPTVSLFGPESPSRYGPVGPQHRVLYSHRPCSPCMAFSNEKRVHCTIGAACLSDLTVEAALAAALELLSEAPGAGAQQAGQG